MQVIDQEAHSLQVVEGITSIQPVEPFFRQFDSPAIPRGLRHPSQYDDIKGNQGVISGDLNAAGDQRHDKNQSSGQQSHSIVLRVSPEPSYKDRSSASALQQVGQDVTAGDFNTTAGRSHQENQQSEQQLHHSASRLSTEPSCERSNRVKRRDSQTQTDPSDSSSTRDRRHQQNLETDQQGRRRRDSHTQTDPSDSSSTRDRRSRQDLESDQQRRRRRDSKTQIDPSSGKHERRDDGSVSQIKTKPQQEVTRSRSNTQEGQALLQQPSIATERAESDCMQPSSITLREDQRPEPQSRSTAQEQEGLIQPRPQSMLTGTSPCMEEEQSYQKESTASSGHSVPPAEVPRSSEEKGLKQNISFLDPEDIPEEESESMPHKLTDEKEPILSSVHKHCEPSDEQMAETDPLLSPEHKKKKHSDKEDPSLDTPLVEHSIEISRSPQIPCDLQSDFERRAMEDTHRIEVKDPDYTYILHFRNSNSPEPTAPLSKQDSGYETVRKEVDSGDETVPHQTYLSQGSPFHTNLDTLAESEREDVGKKKEDVQDSPSSLEDLQMIPTHTQTRTSPSKSSTQNGGSSVT